MNNFLFDSPNAAFLLVLPLVVGILAMLSPILLPRHMANCLSRQVARAVELMSLGALSLGIISIVGLVILKVGNVSVLAAGVLGLDIYFDSLSAVMFLLVSMLGAVVTRYSRNYLSGDLQQGYFAKWLSITLGFVLMLVVSGNLLMFTLVWIATSLSLHKLLTFYSNRPAAIAAARKKFLISRMGDACLLGALILVWKCFGTWNFSELFAMAKMQQILGSSESECITWLSVLLVSGALLKSVQFPFHSWLPDTMETPTPVSALMHAGIINAGGFLIVRLSPIVVHAPAALNALAIVGVFTALFASVVMLTQTSVKRSLAYSTIAQMGFMMMECGLGAFSLAVLHIVAHSLYKAHAFLSSGNLSGVSKAAWVPAERPAAHPIVLASVLLTAVVTILVTGGVVGVQIVREPGVFLLGVIFTMALAYFLWNLWASYQSVLLFGCGIAIGVSVSGVYFASHKFFGWLLESSLPHYSPPRSTLEYGVMAFAALLFMMVLIFQSQLPSWAATRLGRVFYVHASNGFYLGMLVNRLLHDLSKKFTFDIVALRNTYEFNQGTQSIDNSKSCT